ncbi:MAG: hypothetical protein JWR60_2368 [Polaromonas sp.]|nr:hypothetical protein [Polaromonas sp.]
MLHRNMTTSLISLQHGLEDILGDFRFARRSGDLGRLVLLTYCEVRRWARDAKVQKLAERSSALMENFPYPSRNEFLAAVDELVVELEQVHCSISASLSGAHGCHNPDALSNSPLHELH